MDTFIVCIANSFKYLGRCVAGIEVMPRDGGKWKISIKDGTPKWIRPFSKVTSHGEIPNDQAALFSAGNVVKLHDIVPCPDCAHSENVYYSKSEIVDKVQLTPALLDKFCDRVHPNLFENRGKAVIDDVFKNSLTYSLMLVKPDSLEFRYEGKTKSGYDKLRCAFVYKGIRYDFPVTDPVFIVECNNDFAKAINYTDYYLGLSITVEWSIPTEDETPGPAYHFKLVASVIHSDEQASDGWYVAFERPFTPVELDSIQSAVIVASDSGNVAELKVSSGYLTHIPMDAKSTLTVGESFDVRSAKILTYRKEGENDRFTILA